MGVKVREKPKGSGVYWIFINQNKKRTSRRVGSKDAAEKVRKTIEAKLTLGEAALPKDKTPAPTLASYYEGLKETHLVMGVRESTAESYDTSFRLHISPELGTLPLNEIDRDRVKQFVAHLTKKQHSHTVKVKTVDDKGKTVIEKKIVTAPYSKASIRIILAELCAVLNHAREDGHITDNPATRLSKFYKQAG